MSTAGRKSSINKQDYNTPQKYVDAILEFWGEIDLDPCSNTDSIIPAKVKYILPQNGLAESWDYDKVYVNPPFGRSQDGTTIYD